MNSKQIFAKGSRTYYTASRFFPKQLREEVTTLYAFVRVVDDFVDKQPVDKNSFIRYEHEWEVAWKGMPVKDPIISDFILLAKEKKFKKEWIQAFFASMRFDLEKKTCENMKDSLWYMYGSAEVVGLMMAKIMNLPAEAMDSAALLGRSMQYINFIRDVDEDNNLQRKYLPKSVTNGAAFRKDMKEYIATFLDWQHQAEHGFKYIPYHARVAIMTASDMYKWTAKQIEKNPDIAFVKKVKPSKSRIIQTGLKNMVEALWI